MSSDEPFDFARYFTRVQNLPVWHEMQREMVAFAAAEVGQTILDVGTGPGRLVAQLHDDGMFGIGVDASAAVAARFRQNYPDLPLVMGAVEWLPFPSNCFDAALAGNILFFLPSPALGLYEMARVVRPGGWIVNWSPSENMNRAAAAAYGSTRPDLDDFARVHLVNWAGVAETNRRWSRRDLSHLFSEVGLVDFDTKTTLGSLARFARGRKPPQRR